MPFPTQDLLDELATPSHLSIDDARSRLLDFLRFFRDMDLESSECEMLIRAAELSEADPVVRGKLEEGKNLFAGLMRINREISRLVNQATTSYDSIGAWLNGIAEEREIPDPDATEAARKLVIAAHDEIDGIDGDPLKKERLPVVRSVLKDLEPQLAKGLTKTAKVRTDGFRSVATGAGYDTRKPKKKKTSKKG